MSLSLFGIGAQLTEDDGYCTISSLVPGGPADKSKQLNEKDRIVAVAQGNQPPVDVVDMELGRVVQLIRGPKGTEVRLTISPADDRAARRVVTLVRDEIKLEDQRPRPSSSNRPTATAAPTGSASLICRRFTRRLTCPATPAIRRPKAPPSTSRN